MSKGSSILAWDKKYQGAHPRWRGPPEPFEPLVPGARVLELGCGDGKSLRGLVGEGRTVVGIDFSIEALRSSRARTKDDLGLHLAQAEGTNLPFADGSFDVVVARHFFDHLLQADREMAAEEVARVLRNEGKLHFQSFAASDMRAGKGQMLEPSTVLREGIAYHYFEEEEVRSLFGDLQEVRLCLAISEKRFRGEAWNRSLVKGTFRKPLRPCHVLLSGLAWTG